MIQTYIIEHTNTNPQVCCKECIDDVNSLIGLSGIKREDILEYRTNLSSNQENDTTIFSFQITISWWEESI